MSQKRDPLAILINYFTTIDLVQANQALAVAKEIVRSRQPPAPSASHHKGKSKNGDATTRRKAPAPGLPPRPPAAQPSPVPPPGAPLEGFAGL